MTAATQLQTIKPLQSAASRKSIILRAMSDADQWALCIRYLDRENRPTKRYISPIRFVANDRFLALCLCREEPRQFYLDRCESVELVRASELMMPMAIG